MRSARAFAADRARREARRGARVMGGNRESLLRCGAAAFPPPFDLGGRFRPSGPERPPGRWGLRFHNEVTREPLFATMAICSIYFDGLTQRPLIRNQSIRIVYEEY